MTTKSRTRLIAVTSPWTKYRKTQNVGTGTIVCRCIWINNDTECRCWIVCMFAEGSRQLLHIWLFNYDFIRKHIWHCKILRLLNKTLSAEATIWAGKVARDWFLVFACFLSVSKIWLIYLSTCSLKIAADLSVFNAFRKFKLGFTQNTLFTNTTAPALSARWRCTMTSSEGWYEPTYQISEFRYGGRVVPQRFPGETTELYLSGIAPGMGQGCAPRLAFGWIFR
jgi:hypothetical protein